ncbi:MAB_1171c family putative transporter [Nocardia brasiliensis]|uniref:MAB_1171c family putative transporter n=1 Tax=Nocardia brasiliensis TaxID=37326 RepID=UPI00366E9E0E
MAGDRWCVREIRFGDLTGRAKFVCYGLIGGNVVLAVNWSISLVQLAIGSSPLGSHPLRMELAFTICIVNDAAFLGVPVIRSLLVRAGWDRDGRRCRRLLPLWRDLTAAVPQIVMPPVPPARIQDGGPSRLFRMTVEIRDALLQLGPYFHAAPVGNDASPGQPGPAGDMAYYVRRLDYAVQARKAGVAPTDSAAVPRLPRAGNDFDADLRQLLDLAMAWSKRSPDHGPLRLPAISGRALVGGTTKA